MQRIHFSTAQNFEQFSPLRNGWNGIPRVFCSAKQPEFRRNKPIVPSIPTSAEYFLSEIANPSLYA